MKFSFSAVVAGVCLTSLMNPLVSRAADEKSAAEPAPSAKPNSAAIHSMSGEYAGTWQVGPDSGGKLRIVLKQVDGTWSADSSFTFGDATIPAKTKSVKVDAAKVAIVLEWEAQGTTGQTTLSGELKGETLQGTFETKMPDESTSGMWTAARVPKPQN